MIADNLNIGRKTILITGINGFLGSHLAKQLAGNYRILGLEYSVDNLNRIKDCSFEVFLSNEKTIQSLFKNRQIDIVIHTATFYGRGSEGVAQIVNSNLFMPIALLDNAIQSKTTAFINVDTVLDRFVNTYSLTKNQFREWLYLRRNEIKVINMQLEHFYGPGCGSSNFITNMIDKLKQNVPEIDLTLGEQKRDFIYFEDVINAFETVLNKFSSIKESYSNLQVASGQSISIKDLMLLLKEMTGSKTRLNFGALPYRENELMQSEVDIRPLLGLGWTPKYSIKEGLLKTL